MTEPILAAGRPSRRLHLVLVPGFAGFDALGQFEYYPVMTPLFREWQRACAAGSGLPPPVALHYFDNFPTASVAMRASRLKKYLAKRIARGEFFAQATSAESDAIGLVGHSTGGLDIRRLLYELADAPADMIPVDGSGPERGVAAARILQMVKAVVFLSVPQWGTNIADWLEAHTWERKAVVRQLRLAAATARWPVVDRLQDVLIGQAASLTGADLALAIQDALNESDPAAYETAGSDATQAERVAAADEAASQLALWLRHIDADFAAIKDLTVTCHCEECLSPAHFDTPTRNDEITSWREWGIRTRSYATLGPPVSSPESPQDADMDWLYRACYRACARGPFAYPPPGAAPAATPVGESQPRTIALSDNDGIVNTASMFWPDGDATILYRADHMDIVGHGGRVPAVPGYGRRYRAYDLMGSHSGFGVRQLQEVWNGVFDFCAASVMPVGAV